MKKILHIAITLLIPILAYSQNAYFVMSGSSLRVVNSGNAEIVLNNANFRNNASFASFTPSTGTVRFMGTAANASIDGADSTEFYNLRVNKTGYELEMHNNARVTNQAELINGNLNLLNYTLDLSTLGITMGEVYPNGRRFYCLDNEAGRIRATRTLATGANSNIAGLGLDLNFTGSSPGLTSITRGHDRQTSTAFPGAGTSIGRYYDISPTVISGYTYQFNFQYHEQELGAQSGVDEANFLLYRSPSYGGNTADWQQWGAPNVGIGTPGYPTVGWASHDATNNIVSLSGINTFSRWTVSNSIVNPLPIELVSFNAECNDGSATLKWKTASEINNEKFVIHRSNNLQNWEEVITISGAGNSNQELSYSISDERPLEGLSYYRLTQVDYDGVRESFDAVAILCQVASVNGEMVVYPNPTSDVFTVSINSPINVSEASLYFTDVNGKSIHQKNISLTKGTNNFVFDRSSINPGTYFIQLQSSVSSFKPVKLVVY